MIEATLRMRAVVLARVVAYTKLMLLVPRIVLTIVRVELRFLLFQWSSAAILDETCRVLRMAHNRVSNSEGLT